MAFLLMFGHAEMCQLTQPHIPVFYHSEHIKYMEVCKQYYRLIGFCTCRGGGIQKVLQFLKNATISVLNAICVFIYLKYTS